jgi:transcriptional regulator NrdR family protein
MGREPEGTMTPSGRQSVAAVPCPHCGHGHSRAVSGAPGEIVINRAIRLRGYRRRRVCLKCERGFITLEQYVRELT